MPLRKFSTLLLLLGFAGMFLAIAGIPRDWKDIGFLLVGAKTLALGIWIRTHLPSRSSREARASAGRRVPRRGPSRGPFEREEEFQSHRKEAGSVESAPESHNSREAFEGDHARLPRE
ncbi:hypothetical protein D6792_00920 [Candidatus Parcubacteria bacterium]|nr:MAG: hypothetical protein D6792_00920 [Candidatus Parcubacteria bacterium]GIW68615.1 MAG: hypothetical protein KatS3mg100_109 [Candidatus Parcubacteria bacterium]